MIVFLRVRIRRSSTNMDNERLSSIMVMVIVLAVLVFIAFVIYVLEDHFKKPPGYSNMHPVRNKIAEEARIATRKTHIKEEEAKRREEGEYV